MVNIKNSKKYYENGNIKIDCHYKDNMLEDNIYDNKYLEGNYKEYFNDFYNTVWKDINYKDGLLDGIYKEYWEDGTLMTQSNYVNGKLEGKFRSWFESGVLESELEYVNGQLNGEGIEYHDTNDRTKKIIWRRVNYINDKTEGDFEMFYEDGTIRTEKHYKNGNLYGECREYDNGILESKSLYRDNKLNGKFTKYYKNGAISSEEFYIDNKKNGLSKTYYSNGQIEKDCHYKDGQLESYYKSFYHNGGIQIIGHYKDGYKIDKRKEYYFDESKKIDDNTKNILKVEYDYTNKGLDCEYKTYHENGQLKSEGIYKDGELEGNVKEYYNEKEGRLARVSIFKKGQLIKKIDYSFEYYEKKEAQERNQKKISELKKYKDINNNEIEFGY
jgi:antitoxin component YwqK of YwqJK toxin-antitoxin module